MCEITAVTSGKGGSGKTMIASNIAAMLAMDGRRVLLIDMNTGLRNLDMCLGMENYVIFDLADVINGICPVGKALVRDSRFEALYLLSASQNCDKAHISDRQMKKLCKMLAEKFDHIVIDTPSGLGDEWLTAVSPADSAIIVMTQEYSSVRAADTIDMKLKKTGIEKTMIIINRVMSEYSSSGLFPTIAEMSSLLRSQIIGVVQDDINIHIAMNKGVPVVCKNDTYIKNNFEKIIDKLYEA
jgi:septum site-determining protein MinD